MSELHANPFARAVAGHAKPATLFGRIGVLVLRVVVAVLLVAAATFPFAILIGLFTSGVKGNIWALSAGITTVVLTTLMGLGRKKTPQEAAIRLDAAG